MANSIFCFLTSISGHTYAPDYNTDEMLEGYDGWHDWARAQGCQNTSRLGDYPILEGETAGQAFKRVCREYEWPREGDLQDFVTVTPEERRKAIERMEADYAERSRGAV